MSIMNMAKNIKQIHPDSVICYRTGKFYSAYGKDCYILSDIFNYKINKIQNDIPRCGFPINATKRVMAKLEERKIDYIFLDVKNNYDIEEKISNGNLNKYTKVLEKSYKKVKTKSKIENIMDILKSQIDEPNFIDKLNKIEDIINEKWKI